MDLDQKPTCILFSGCVGCGKTPVAYFLSQRLGWPIFSNDALRSETIENTLKSEFNNNYYGKLQNSRLKKLLSTNRSFIYDASIDRSWQKRKNQLRKYNYRLFIISFNLSYGKLEELARLKGYRESLARLGQLTREHQSFIDNCTDDINCVIDDKNFTGRMDIAFQAVENYLSNS